MSPLPKAYDEYCPSVKDSIASRTCPGCALYHPTKVAMTVHKAACHGKDFLAQCPAARVRPHRVIGKRNNEYLCVFRSPSGDEDADWVDVEDLDTETAAEYHEPEPTPLPVAEPLSQWLQSPWEDV